MEGGGRGVTRGEPQSCSRSHHCLLIRVSLGRACPCTGGSCKTQCGKTWIIPILGVVWNAHPSSRLPWVVQGTGI